MDIARIIDDLMQDWNTEHAQEFRAPMCRDCGDVGPWWNPRETRDTSYADWAASHAAATEHRNVADLKLSYGPGRIEPGFGRI